jgi:hypothetical protein
LDDVVDGQQNVCDVFLVIDVERRESDEAEVFDEVADGF